MFTKWNSQTAKRDPEQNRRSWRIGHSQRDPAMKYTVYCTALFMNPFNFGLSICTARPEYILIGVYYIYYLCITWANYTGRSIDNALKYMWMLCIRLKERNTKRFVQNWHSPKSPSTEWSWFFLIELVMFSLFAMQLYYWNIQSVWSIIGNLTVYMLISCIWMPEHFFRSGKSCKMYAIFTMFSSSEVSFQHF